MSRVCMPLVLSFLPGLMSEDAKLSSQTMLEFAESLFTDPAEIPWSLKCNWLGMAVHQSPVHRSFVVSRPQDPNGLHELGASGLPLLVLYGTQDKQVNGKAVAEEMQPYFKHLEVCAIERNGSHAVHHDNVEELLAAISKFVDSLK